ncbi:MAG: ribonuclease HII [Thermoleophilia bacterium]
MAGRISSVALFEYDRERCGAAPIAGADEAGRGCLAGPLVAAAVVLDYSAREPSQFAELLMGLTDSKKLTALSRQRLYPLIMRHASRLSIIVTGSRAIDEQGVQVVNMEALSQSLMAVAPLPAVLLVDGRLRLPSGPEGHEAVTGGDSKSACVAAASVIAKVTRDRLMHGMDEQYPDYGFAQHMGYGTRDHRAAIARNGLTPLHRRSFSMGPMPGIDGVG